MTRKDFEAIAEVLNANHASFAIVSDMADMLEETNPRFDRGLFFKAATSEIREDAARLVRMLDRAILE